MYQFLLKRLLLEGLNTITKNRIPVILLFGPTAVGKTDLLLKLFEGRGEVINADSMQVYNHLDIGSAKPTDEYVKKIPHHLISIIEPTKQFSVSDFVEEADKKVTNIYSRGLLPVISGGTAFYFKNFIHGLPNLPKIDDCIRQDIQEELKTNGLKYLYDKLISLDPSIVGEINPGDTYRVTRALEVFTQTGSSILKCKQSAKKRDKYEFLIIGLKRDREELYSRINLRVDIMFDQGLLKEFKDLYKSGLTPEDPGMKGIGYSEFFQMMQSGCWDIEELKEEIRRNSRRYAKRQITFFKSFDDVIWINPENLIELKRVVEEFLVKNS